MTKRDTAMGGIDTSKVDIAQRHEPSIRSALPHDLPLGIFPLTARLGEPRNVSPETCLSSYARMGGGLNDVERAARFLQLTRDRADLDSPAPTAAAEPPVRAATMWRDLQGITGPVCENEWNPTTAGPKVRSLVASACGYEDRDALNAEVTSTTSRTAAQIDALLARR